jgi:hypothetical protein
VSNSIFELFGGEGLEGEDAGGVFDVTKLNEVLDKALQDRPIAGAPAGYQPRESLAPNPGGDAPGAADGDLGAGAPPVAPEAASPPAPPVPVADPLPPEPVLPVTPPAPVPDPFAGMSDTERFELLQLRQALADPERALQVKRAALGIPEQAAAAAAPEPESTLPEHIDPGSFEAQLWHQNQEMQRELRELRGGLQQQNQQTEQQIMLASAKAAGERFTAKYGDRLAPEEIQAIAIRAGNNRLPEAFRAASGSWEEAMEKSLEFELRSNDALLAKVLGVGQTAPPPNPNERTAEAVHRQRQLTALSSAASPSGDVPQRTPLEHRGDGRLTEQSRLGLVKEFMNSLQGTGEGIS